MDDCCSHLDNNHSCYPIPTGNKNMLSSAIKTSTKYYHSHILSISDDV